MGCTGCTAVKNSGRGKLRETYRWFKYLPEKTFGVGSSLEEKEEAGLGCFIES
ncbi:hypothetical protein M422DRAFT_38442 [Sphaerobolus stellatus SS14]|uniref:Unplaced genomic scaffold SPHSTscaffold_320, whole genome shotgun sequence n=1 Tax=Sphaerobolus stellatus (strain SS14) TaxID=990650 RepID=A0A0C9T9X5_SPHS4|nr:hypothetical protein M422DRAFT_38442 [Sphaerobolus stellatus SS14]